MGSQREKILFLKKPQTSFTDQAEKSVDGTVQGGNVLGALKLRWNSATLVQVSSPATQDGDPVPTSRAVGCCLVPEMGYSALCYVLFESVFIWGQLPGVCQPVKNVNTSL